MRTEKGLPFLTFTAYFFFFRFMSLFSHVSVSNRRGLSAVKYLYDPESDFNRAANCATLFHANDTSPFVKIIS